MENDFVQGLVQLEYSAWSKWGIIQQSKAKHSIQVAGLVG